MRSSPRPASTCANRRSILQSSGLGELARCSLNSPPAPRSNTPSSFCTHKLKPNRLRLTQAPSMQSRASDLLTGSSIPVIPSQLTILCATMARTDIDKRSRLVSAAVGLAYQNGFGATSLADIAREAEVPLGNVYYYFKTKDEIGEAIVELRLAQLSAQRERWNEAGSPKDRLCACVQDVFKNKDFLAQRILSPANIFRSR